MNLEEVGELAKALGKLCLQQQGLLEAQGALMDAFIATLHLTQPAGIEVLRSQLLNLEQYRGRELEEDAFHAYQTEIATQLRNLDVLRGR
ncbi:MAG: hypothetical protein EPO09_04960 [Aquabacterium sp.]|uniref:hypothetical protein n=1 Tax=Aquabacterium sp. TaxID=1872578 RepID=UPI00121F9A64|nr:hypothetical protein [Aquabacterium sp.]TAK97061.1 MAG: hypothetical protein EPO09_04960 [Aquabacterium sp.]